ncbi:hypothetical protein [Variovorax sp. GT1P44]|uniref:hypothetical protein n=1 Tax=Variovorax sp. GT1P44 TaxID=3443742 RepID=UPI003F48CC52
MPSAGESAPDSTQSDLAALSKQATAEVDAVREAHVALACVNKVLLHAPGLLGNEAHVSRFELKALASLVKSEVERRLRAAHSTIAAMQRISPKLERSLTEFVLDEFADQELSREAASRLAEKSRGVELDIDDL